MKIAPFSRFKTSWMIVLLSVIAFGLWLRLPAISAGMPYFYDEDEGHHFNRLVNMFKSGDLNPRYFHKPSFHFYARLPVVAASYIWLKAQGDINSRHEIRTRDRFGIGDYAFAASHPTIVKWNRAYSVVWSLAIVILAGLIAIELSIGYAALLAIAICAASPALISYSGVIGVDTMMTALCYAAVYAALIAQRKFSLWMLACCGALCGLAISTKYNAAPIALLPLATSWAAQQLNRKTIFLSISIPIAAFFIASPFILISPMLFWQQMSYEVWHYAIAGHAEHTAERGIPQLLFYTAWLEKEAIGKMAFVFGLFGILAIIRKGDRRSLLVLIFPLLYILEMVLQRTNFVRNMLVAVPLFSLGASLTLSLIWHNASKKLRAPLVTLCAMAALSPLLAQSFKIRDALLESRESRNDLGVWLREIHSTPTESAISGELQLAPALYSISGITVVDSNKLDPNSLYCAGVDRLIVPSRLIPTLGNLHPYSTAKIFEGDLTEHRIVNNPGITVLEKTLVENTCRNSELVFSEVDGSLRCSHSPGENYCWTNSRVTKITLNYHDKPTNVVSIELMSPWTNQTVTLISGEWKQELTLREGGKWTNFPISLPSNVHEFNLLTAHIHSPQTYKINNDSRRLGVAIKGFAFAE